MNPPKLTILAADTDAACDPETGTCTISQTPIPSPGAVLPGMAETPSPLPGQARTRPETARCLVPLLCPS